MNILKGVGILVAFLAVIFVVGLFGLGWMKFFEPRKENIRREVFEQTKSYVHGKTQDLAKYYQEYQNAGTEADKAAIKEIVRLRFAEFDMACLNSLRLKRFLVEMRGY